MLSELRNSAKVVGVKQTRKALRDNSAVKVFIAEDAEQRVLRPIMELCAEQNTPTETVPTMQDLGQACGIEVGAACAAILK